MKNFNEMCAEWMRVRAEIPSETALAASTLGGGRFESAFEWFTDSKTIATQDEFNRLMQESVDHFKAMLTFTERMTKEEINLSNWSIAFVDFTLILCAYIAGRARFPRITSQEFATYVRMYGLANVKVNGSIDAQFTGRTPSFTVKTANGQVRVHVCEPLLRMHMHMYVH